MHHQAQNIRAFIGTQDYQNSISFYEKLGFQRIEIGDKMMLFKVNESLGFYLQNYYVKDWVDNSMLFLQVEDLDQYFIDLKKLELEKQYPKVRIDEIKAFEWGRVVYMHDPAGVLWHICEFPK